MSVTKVSNYVIEDGSVTLSKLDVVPGTAGQVLSTDGSGNLLFSDKLVAEDVEDVVANLIASGTHTNITITYNDAAGSLSFNASGAVTSVNGKTGAVSLTTTSITEGNNLYYTQSRFDTAFSAKSTDNLAEGATNLYYTQSRSRNSLSVVDAGGDGSLTYNSTTGTITYTGPTTSEIRSHFSAGTGVSLSNGVISIGQSVATTADVTFNDVTASGNISISGNLTVTGTTTTINATELAIEDNMIYLNEGSTVTNPDLGWVGNYNDGTYAHAGVFRDATDGVFKFFDSYVPEPGQSINVSDATYNSASINANNVLADGYVTATYFSGDGANLTSVLTNYTTTELTEGTNLYYTDARVDTRFATKSTTDLTEGTNLYFTDERAQDAVAAALVAGTNTSIVYDDALNTITISATSAGGMDLSQNDTDDLTEGSANLYYTDERVDDRVSSLLVAGTNISLTYDDGAGTLTIASNGLTGNTTDNLTEGSTNLYFTDERAQDAVASMITGGTHTNITVSYDDVNNTFSFTGVEDNFTNNTTDDLAEGSTNLYFTNARARNTISVVDPSGHVTYNSITGVFTVSPITDAEIRSRFSGGTGVTYDSGTGVISIGQDVATTADVTFNDIQADGDITVQGNLTVSGTTTTVNTQEILLADNIITLNSDLGATSSPIENAGIEINRGALSNVAIRWNEAVDSWQFTNDGTVYQNIGSLSASSTDDLAEGSTNLYYTDARVDAFNTSGNATGFSTTGIVEATGGVSAGTGNVGGNNFIALGYLNVMDTQSVGSMISGDLTVTGVITGNVTGNVTGTVSTLSNHDTDDLAEGVSNLYYTDQRVDDYVSGGTLTAVDTVGGATIGGTVVATGNVSGANITSDGVLTIQDLQQTGSLIGGDLTVNGDFTTLGAITGSIDFSNLTNVPTVSTQSITGTGVTGYTLNAAPGSADAIIVTIQGVTQFPGSDYTVSGTTLTFSSALPNGQVALVRYVGYQSLGGVADNDLSLAGGTMTGSILVGSDNTYDLGSAANQWRTIYGHEVEATYADLAERYASDAPYEPGTVVVFGGEAEITTTTTDLDVAVAGVISTNPALKLNSQAGNSQTHPYVALRGRVPCKVVGPVRKGDLLVTSTTAGFAKSVGKKDMGHSVFAKSITEDLSEGTKTIEVVII